MATILGKVKNTLNNFMYTDEQLYLINDICDWFMESNTMLYEFSGAAGTGKSSVLHEVIFRLNLLPTQYVPMAYTGTAAIVMRKNGFFAARTIHSSLFKFSIDKNTKEIKKEQRYINNDVVKLFIIDEASMVNEELKNLILSYGIKTIACGDLNQLHPIYGNPGFLQDKNIYRLTKIMRQESNSGIVITANKILNGMRIDPGDYGNILIVNKSKLTVDDNKRYFSRYGLVLCHTNKTRSGLNDIIRNILFKDIYHNSPYPGKGERIICKQNNWSYEVDGINLVNGMYGTVCDIMKSNKISTDGYFTIDFKPEFTLRIFDGIKCDSEYFFANEEDKKRMRDMSVVSIYDNYGPSFNKFDFAYAITVHSSQGSQFGSGIYLEEEDYYNANSVNIKYTAITRFVNKCIYIMHG